MRGFLALVLHGHLPFVRHPEHEFFLEENWLFEAIAECYLPLLKVLEGWADRGMRQQITVTLTPTLCEMLRDPLLQNRCVRYLEGLVELAEKEICRNTWQAPQRAVAEFYHQRFVELHRDFLSRKRDLLTSFRALQDAGYLEIIASSATHAVLPLLLDHPPSVRAQLATGRDVYLRCFGRPPRGIWLPECAYDPRLDPFLRQTGLRWFFTETHGIMHAHPRPIYGTFAPLLTPAGLAAFGRDPASARQVWSRHGGYPGDVRYREFYRDVGFDLDWDYIKPYLGGSIGRSFSGLKYHRITGPGAEKAVYERQAALRAADEHATHFLSERIKQFESAAQLISREPIIAAPYDAELFGHWWYEGPEFLDLFGRKAYYDQNKFVLASPEQFLETNSIHQISTPSPSSWGEGGHWSMWLSPENEWVYAPLRRAQQRMSVLASRLVPTSDLEVRALKQAARELLLCQSSDWAFIMRTRTSAAYARNRFLTHLDRFNVLAEQITRRMINESVLADIESRDTVFADVEWRYWRT